MRVWLWGWFAVLLIGYGLSPRGSGKAAPVPPVVPPVVTTSLVNAGPPLVVTPAVTTAQANTESLAVTPTVAPQAETESPAVTPTVAPQANIESPAVTPSATPQADTEPPVVTPAPPDQATLGVYILSLHDLDPAKNSFGADFWVWSNHTHTKLNPLKTLEYVNARQTSSSLYTSEPKGKLIWSQQKVQGTFRYHWDMRNFPFDRHTLTIFLEEGLADANQLVYAADTRESNVAKDIAIEGYTLKGLRVTAESRNYDSNFGDPTAEPTSQYARLRVTLDIERSSRMLFFKLHFAMYAAFLVSAFGFLMLPNIPSMMNTVNSLVVGALFATIINLRAVDSVIGRGEELTLVDRLHALSFLHFVILGLISVGILVTRSRWKDTTLRRFSWLASAAYLISYIAGNALLIWQAASA